MSWLKKSTWLLCIAVGWALAFTAWCVKPDDAASALMILAVAFMGFGIGWIVRDERGDR